MKRSQLRQLCKRFGLTIQDRGGPHLHVYNRHGLRIGVVPRSVNTRDVGCANRNMVANMKRNAERKPDDGLAA